MERVFEKQRRMNAIEPIRQKRNARMQEKPTDHGFFESIVKNYSFTTHFSHWLVFSMAILICPRFDSSFFEYTRASRFSKPTRRWNI